MNKFPTTRSQFNFFYFLHKTIFILYNWIITFSCRHLTDIKTLSLLTKLADNAKQVDYNSHSAKQNWKNKKNCYRYQRSSQRSLSPFWFQLLTTFSSFIGRDFYHRQLLVFRIKYCENQNHYCHTDHQLHKSCHSQTWYTFFCSNSYRLYTYTPDIPICHCVYGVHALWMSWQFPLIFFEFADQPIMKTLSVILVWAYRKHCVHL